VKEKELGILEVAEREAKERLLGLDSAALDTRRSSSRPESRRTTVGLVVKGKRQ
jgi:hypothetical protein